MRYYPVFLDFDGAEVLVVGAGEIAARKLRLMRRTAANITVVAPEACLEIQEWAKGRGLTWHARAFADGDVVAQRYVVAATSDASLNRRVSALAKAQNIPVNVVDDAEACTAITPAIVDRDPVVVAIGTEGAAPVIARRLRERIEGLLSPRLGKVASFIRAQRDAVKSAVPEDQRRRVWEKVLDGPGAAAIESGDLATAMAAMKSAMQQAQAPIGHVALVGAGPGAPDLLTLRALRLMQDADVVLHDRLVPAPVMELVRRDAQRINVGKQQGRHPVPQKRINELLIEQARAGKRVVRLKGGDPFIFGRGGEEITDLAAAGITFEVVPGVTAANACSAYAGIPLTHRDHAQSVIFVTGHRKADGELSLPWFMLARPAQTVVIYMGLGSLEESMEALLNADCPPDRPVAVVQDGGLPGQVVVTGQVGDIAERVAQAELRSPALVLIGDVVRLRDKLAWFGAKTT